MRYLLGIDNGGTVIKAAVFDERGRQIAAHSCRVEIKFPKAGFTERSLEEVWAANAEAIKGCLLKAGLNGGDIASVALSGHGKGLYLTDKAGKPVCDGILSTDSRAIAYEERWVNDGTADKVFQKTFQKVLACQPVSLLRWFKDNNRKVYDSAAHIMSVIDYIRFCLTGEIFAEMTCVSGTNLLNLKTRSYDKELLSEFGIDETFDKLPPVKLSGELCGAVTKKAAALTGLKEGTPVAGGLFDINACALGSGITNNDNICVIGGTWSINEYISKTPVIDKSISMNSIYCLPEFYLIEECSPTSASNLEWFVNAFMSGEVKKADGLGKMFYDALNIEAESSRLNKDGVLFLPFIFASNEGAGIKGGFYNFDASAGRAELLRAVYEGIVFSHKSHIDKLLSSRSKPNAVRLAGGAANSPFWAQMFADVLNLPVETIDDKELGCFGACLTAGVAVGVYKDLKEAVRKTVKISHRYEPDKENGKIYSEKYGNYRGLIKRLSKDSG